MAGKDKPAAKAAEAAPAVGNNKKKIIILAVAAVLMMALSVVGTVLVLKKSSGSGEGEHAAAKEEVHEPHPIFIALAPSFIANFQTTSKQHLIKVEISVETKELEADAAISSHMPLLRNAVLTEIGKANFEGLQEDAGREALRTSILAALRAVLEKETGKPMIDQVYFTGFVMQ